MKRLREFMHLFRCCATKHEYFPAAQAQPPHGSLEPPALPPPILPSTSLILSAIRRKYYKRLIDALTEQRVTPFEIENCIIDTTDDYLALYLQPYQIETPPTQHNISALGLLLYIRDNLPETKANSLLAFEIEMVLAKILPHTNQLQFTKADTMLLMDMLIYQAQTQAKPAESYAHRVAYRFRYDNTMLILANASLKHLILMRHLLATASTAAPQSISLAHLYHCDKYKRMYLCYKNFDLELALINECLQKKLAQCGVTLAEVLPKLHWKTRRCRRANAILAIRPSRHTHTYQSTSLNEIRLC